MTTAELEYSNIASDIYAMSLFAKASYCKVKPSEKNKNPHSDNTQNGAENALESWYPNSVCRLGFNPTKNREYKTKLKTAA